MADQLNKSTRPRVATAAAGRHAAGAIRVPGAMRGVRAMRAIRAVRAMRAIRAVRAMRAVPVIWIILAATLHGGCVAPAEGAVRPTPGRCCRCGSWSTASTHATISSPRSAARDIFSARQQHHRR